MSVAARPDRLNNPHTFTGIFPGESETECTILFQPLPQHTSSQSLSAPILQNDFKDLLV